MTLGIGFNGGFQQMNQMYGNSRHKGSVLQGLQDKYGCEDCFEKGPYFAQYPIPVQQVPIREVKPTLWQKIVDTFLGGT